MEVTDTTSIWGVLTRGHGAIAAFRVLVAYPLTILFAAAHDPFPVGFSMGNGGAIIQTNGPTGRQPWTAACFSSDTFRFGISVSGIDYYDAMNNQESSHIGQVVSGLWYSRRPFILKASYAYFNALSLYNEQQGFISLGFIAATSFSASIDMTANRAGLSDKSDGNEKFLNAGASLLLSGRFAALSLSCGHVPLKRASSPGFEPPVGVEIGLYTTAHRFGAQGVVCEITKESDYAFRFSFGESYCISDHVALSGALSTNPFIMHFGLVFSGAGRAVSISFVNHPALGWSKGLTLDYARR